MEETLSYAGPELQLRHGMALAPRLQQSVKFLQMSTLEFQQAVRHALETNPFLEEAEEESDPVAACADIALSTAPAAGGELLPAGPADTLDEPAPPAPDAPDAPYPGDYPQPAAQGDMDPFAHKPTRRSLRDRLLGALGTLPLSERDRMLASYLIDSLDPDGYLRQPLDSLSEDGAFDPPAEEAEWRMALGLVQQLHAPGIGARDLRECLMLQLRAREDAGDPAHRLALAIVDGHLPRLARNDWAGLRRELEADDATLRQACELIRTLDPKPGLRYDDSPIAYPIPDVVIDKVGARWRVRLNEAAIPRARLHRQYADWFQRARCDSREPLQRELQEARWLIRNVEQRYATILRVAEAIVLRQRRFFDYGDVALRPLMLHEIAEDLDIHESTVSRATAGKYMLTPRGLYEFRHFFSRELGTEGAGSCSAGAVRALIQELIDAEDPAQPLSDVDLTQQLARHGIRVARRTVTKYRGQLKIPAVELRRVHY
ncbi:RNA polymerase factor sigma-54 [Castellaniella defragrans]|uniref:RNA polymerase factor sigma-54 n=1 Tax=Castellaniella defragrans TaxID=75697 RepID=UPI001248AE79|nr:RNA polymerase factor sigma-54 [Castellaniella defragrans]KAB0622597.1 RNA polymerase factor sigma-54 [Castellaniella defragrans]